MVQYVPEGIHMRYQHAIVTESLSSFCPGTFRLNFYFVFAVFGSSTLRSLTPYRTPRSHASDRVLSRTAPVNVLSDLTPFRTPSTYAPARGLSSTAPLMAQQVFSPQDDGLRRCEMCCGELDAHIAGYALPIRTCSEAALKALCDDRCDY